MSLAPPPKAILEAGKPFAVHAELVFKQGTVTDSVLVDLKELEKGSAAVRPPPPSPLFAFRAQQRAWMSLARKASRSLARSSACPSAVPPTSSASPFLFLSLSAGRMGGCGADPTSSSLYREREKD